jgi:lysophospholipase L1-like esterase
MNNQNIFKLAINRVIIFLVVIVISVSCTSNLGDVEYASPTRFSDAIAAFDLADSLNPPPKGAIVCIGSSSIRGWHENIKDDLSPLTIIPRGFGGSNMNDALYFTDRIVLPYEPRAIVVYEGDNDIAQKITPKKILNTFRLFVTEVHTELPQCRIYFLSIKPSISRWSLWQKMEKANNLIAQECSKDQRLTFVDVSSNMLDKEGKPQKELFLEDDLHMTRAGYLIWKDILKPILIEAELQFEQQ